MSTKKTQGKTRSIKNQGVGRQRNIKIKRKRKRNQKVGKSGLKNTSAIGQTPGVEVETGRQFIS
jgi:hypothetical protein